MSSGNYDNPVLLMMQQADHLARQFDETHKQTIPMAERIHSVLLRNPSAMDEGGDDGRGLELLFDQLRTALMYMEQRVGEMMAMLYQVDVFLAAPMQAGVSGKDPKTALEHVSDLFHMYQSELLEKREALADLTCEECSPDQFAARWCSMEQVHAGRQQTIDDLADLLAGLG